MKKLIMSICVLNVFLSIEDADCSNWRTKARNAVNSTYGIDGSAVPGTLGTNTTQVAFLPDSVPALRCPEAATAPPARPVQAAPRAEATATTRPAPAAPRVDTAPPDRPEQAEPDAASSSVGPTGVDPFDVMGTPLETVFAETGRAFEELKTLQDAKSAFARGGDVDLSTCRNAVEQMNTHLRKAAWKLKHEDGALEQTYGDSIGRWTLVLNSAEAELKKLEQFVQARLDMMNRLEVLDRKLQGLADTMREIGEVKDRFEHLGDAKPEDLSLLEVALKRAEKCDETHNELTATLVGIFSLDTQVRTRLDALNQGLGALKTEDMQTSLTQLLQKLRVAGSPKDAVAALLRKELFTHAINARGDEDRPLRANVNAWVGFIDDAHGKKMLLRGNHLAALQISMAKFDIKKLEGSERRVELLQYLIDLLEDSRVHEKSAAVERQITSVKGLVEKLKKSWE